MNATAIAWTDWTDNWQAGCSDDGPECRFCYARVMSRRQAAIGTTARYADTVRIDGGWTGRIAFDAAAMDRAFASFRRIRKPTRIFVGSMTDLFHDNGDPFNTYALAEHIKGLDASGAPVTLQILTKRPENALEWQREHFPLGLPRCVWMGTTAGYQKGWDYRVKHLREIRAHVRFVSAEPLLERIEPTGLDEIEWLIVGGESGPHARPMDLEWTRHLVTRAREAGVAPFVKQLGSKWGPTHGDLATWPADLRVQEFPTPTSEPTP